VDVAILKSGLVKVKKVIKCTLQPIVRKYCPTEGDKKPKYGIYLQQMYWDVKGYGKKVWMVAVRIDLDYDKAKETCETNDEIVQKCVEFLNTPLKSKYGKRRKRKSLYTFEMPAYSYKIVEKDGTKIISAKLKTKERKNKYFWGSGISL